MRKSLKSLALGFLAVCILAGFYLLPSDDLKSQTDNSPLFNSSLKEAKERLVTGLVQKTQVGSFKKSHDGRETVEITCLGQTLGCGGPTCEWTCGSPTYCYFTFCGEPTCSGNTCEGTCGYDPTCDYSCQITWCSTCMPSYCETFCTTCETCDMTYICPTCVETLCYSTCASTCYITCASTCAATCAATCATTCAVTCQGATCAVTCTGPGCSFPNLNIILTPLNPPITIPAAGGTFRFLVSIGNLETTPQICDAWSMVKLPDLSWVGPFLAQRNLTLAPQSAIEFSRVQYVPARAPQGNYEYWGYLGSYPDEQWYSSYFLFTKTAASESIGSGTPLVSDWFCSEANPTAPFSALLESDNAQQIHADAYPNPFNPMTSIHFTLAQPAPVTLQIFDINGKTVASPLLNQQLQAGEQSVLFDGSSLPTGIYVYRLQTGKYQASGKMILLK